MELLLLLGKWEPYLVMRLWKMYMIYLMTATLSGKIYWCCLLWLLHTKFLVLFCWSLASGKTSVFTNFSAVTKHKGLQMDAFSFSFLEFNAYKIGNLEHGSSLFYKFRGPCMITASFVFIVGAYTAKSVEKRSKVFLK